jgi:predicted ATP-dependent endonuclease of OLD family
MLPKITEIEQLKNLKKKYLNNNDNTTYMRLESLKINGYKNLNIDLKHQTDIIAAIGNNGSGKSNLLEALCYIFQSLYDKSSVDFTYEIVFKNSDNKVIRLNKDKSKKPLMYVDNILNVTMERFLPKRIVVIYSGEEDRLWKNCIEPFYQKYVTNINKSATQGTMVAELLPQILYLNKFYWHIALLSLICSDSEDNKLFVKEILKIDKIEKIKFDFNTEEGYHNYARSEILRFIESIDSKMEYTLEEFNQVLEQNNYNADDVFKYLYTAFTPKTTKIIEDITIIFNGHLTIEDLSEGEKKLLLIKAALEFAGQEDSLFILDEPDAHIHVTNKEEIVKMFNPYKNNRQIVFTTHSPTLTNCLDDNNLYMLDCGEIMQKEKQEKLNHLIGNSWSKHEVGAFLANKKNMILLVEGKHDKIHIETAFNKLRDEYSALDFAIYSIGGESKIKPLMIGLYEADGFENKTYIAIYDNDKAGDDAFKNGFDKDQQNAGYKKLHKDQKEHDNFFAFLLPKPDGFTEDYTIENMFNALKYEEAYQEAINKTLGYFANKSIIGIHTDITNKSKNILAENSKNFAKEDFTNFRSLFDLLLKIQNRNNSSLSVNHAKTNIDSPKTDIATSSPTKEQKYYFLKAKGIEAKGYLDGKPIPNKESKIVVCKDSKAISAPAASWLKMPAAKKREELIQSGILSLIKDEYIFTKDYRFNSVSVAASIILGYNANGWNVWKNKKSQTLNDIFRRKD